MIEIVFTKDEKGNYRGFSCHGHAGAGAYGEDIVCAAVSALTMLGFAPAASAKAVDKILQELPEAKVEQVIRAALKML